MFMRTMRESIQLGLFSKQHWMKNLISGLIVGIVALPLAMAFAIASGAKPEQGLYTAIVAGFFVSVFGGSRVQIAGPTGAFIVILSGITAKYGIEGLQIATLMAGIMLILMGLARLGNLMKWIPDTVITGFTAGIAFVIWIGQWPSFFGIASPHGTHFHEKLWQTLLALQYINIPTTIMALASLGIVIFSKKIILIRKIPAPLLVLLFATTTQSIFHFTSVATIGSTFGGIPQGLPHFQWITWTPEKVIELLGPALSIAMLGAIESLLSAVVADGMSQTKHHPNQELIGQGLANIAAPLFGGFAATGAIARTATNIRNGANSPLAGIIHCLTLVLIVILLAPLADNIPLASLAAILFNVAWNMSDAKNVLVFIKKAPFQDITVLSTTLLLTIFVDLVMAVGVGVALSIALNWIKNIGKTDSTANMPDKL